MVITEVKTSILYIEEVPQSEREQMADLLMYKGYDIEEISEDSPTTCFFKAVKKEPKQKLETLP